MPLYTLSYVEDGFNSCIDLWQGISVEELHVIAARLNANSFHLMQFSGTFAWSMCTISPDSLLMLFTPPHLTLSPVFSASQRSVANLVVAATCCRHKPLGDS